MALEDARTEIDAAFTRDGFRGRSFENAFAGATSFLRCRYAKDLTGVDLAITRRAVRPGGDAPPRRALRPARDPRGLDAAAERSAVRLGLRPARGVRDRRCRRSGLRLCQASRLPRGVAGPCRGAAGPGAGPDRARRGPFDHAADPAGACGAPRAARGAAVRRPFRPLARRRRQAGSTTAPSSTRRCGRVWWMSRGRSRSGSAP